MYLQNDKPERLVPW